MLESLQRNWWLVALRGLLAFILGIVMFLYPIASVYVLVIFFGVYSLADGLFAVTVSLMSAAHHKHKWWLFVEGVFGILVGIIIFAWPAITAAILLYFIAFWALFTGVLEIGFCVAQWQTLPNSWLWLISGMCSILLGIAIFANPGTGAMATVMYIAIYLIIFGLALMVQGFILKKKMSLDE